MTTSPAVLSLLELKVFAQNWLLSQITGRATAGRTCFFIADNKKPAIPYTGMAGFFVSFSGHTVSTFKE
jgi:hypothetical protein